MLCTHLCFPVCLSVCVCECVCVRERDERQWQMSGEESCVRGAVSDRSLCLALRVTSGTRRPLGSAGAGNYPLLTHTHRMPTLHCPQRLNDGGMGTWHKVGLHKLWCVCWRRGRWAVAAGIIASEVSDEHDYWQYLHDIVMDEHVVYIIDLWI